MSTATSAQSRFSRAYAEHRAAEGRAHAPADLLSLPWLAEGPAALRRQWAVRSRTFDTFMRRIVAPRIGRARRTLQVLDVGAGNGWLSHRLARAGCEAVALDLRADDVDGLGAAATYQATGAGFPRVAGSFAELPVADGRFDIVVFNAAIHYALDLGAVLREARRVTRTGGAIVVLDSPFYRRARDGEAMVAEKRATARQRFGDRAGPLLALPFIEFLTPAMLAEACAPLGVAWRRHRVRYPLWYELRPLQALVRGRRNPSRFDCWEGTVR